MNKYELRTKSGEKIHHTYANTLFDAREKLSKIKSLPINQLLEIFTIEEIK
jgi:hypothetical protein